MDILKKLFPKKDPLPATIETACSIIDRFAMASSANIDREDLARYPARQFKVMAFHYGAIEYLSQRLGLDETQTLGVFVVFMKTYFSMPITETGSISERLQGFRDKPDERRFFEAGLDVFRRWDEQDDQQAPLQLGELLKKY
ncbi:MAG: hypothetical protein OEU63_04550 [Gammaproteobacteria bacterium]|jgi:hypothetical protein|nr:hypothetical protein [Gammaproteobacteria bacterium]MDH3934140.1 hypothetical protein [Gammaproteobacteria bacterium]MDH3971429.1 hypothetical protein [Gammaproteobacteria bacterium]